MDPNKEKNKFKNAPVKPFVYVDAKTLPGLLAVYREDVLDKNDFNDENNKKEKQ